MRKTSWADLTCFWPFIHAACPPLPSHIEARTFYSYALQRLPGVVRSGKPRPVTEDLQRNDTEEAWRPFNRYNGCNRKTLTSLCCHSSFVAMKFVYSCVSAFVCACARRSMVYMADLESALHYSLRVELSAHPVFKGETLNALKSYISVLAKVRGHIHSGRSTVDTYTHFVDRLKYKWWISYYKFLIFQSITHDHQCITSATIRLAYLL